MKINWWRTGWQFTSKEIELHFCSILTVLINLTTLPHDTQKPTHYIGIIIMMWNSLGSQKLSDPITKHQHSSRAGSIKNYY